MDKKKVTGLTVGAILFVLLVLLYFFNFRGGPQEKIATSGSPSGPSAATPPATQAPAAIPTPQELAPQKLPGTPAPQELGPRKQAAPPLEQAGPSKAVAPGSEATPRAPVTVFPPEKKKEYYGFLVNRYRNYGSASKMQEKMKKRGVFGFIQPAPKHPGLSELWAGPFSDLGKAKAAEKSIRDLLKGPRKIHKIKGTIPK
jgi:uncharacterized iron-regulated membrane protein